MLKTHWKHITTELTITNTITDTTIIMEISNKKIILQII